LKIVVLGSNSFSGAHFIARLLKEHHQVLGISRSGENSKIFRPYSWEKSQGHFLFLQADMNKNHPTIIKEIKRFDPEVIINFAAQSMVAESWNFPQHWYQTNLVALSLFIDEIINLPRLIRYIHVTTPEVYGSTHDWIAEHSHFAPSTPYAVSRAAADMHLAVMHHSRNLPVIFTRTANIYGPGQPLYRIVPKTILSALLDRKLYLDGGGTSKRSFIHIHDASEATLKIVTAGEIGSTYHISTNEVISIRDLVRKIYEKVKGNFEENVTITEDRVGKDSGYFLRSTKIRQELNWEPKVNLDFGLEQTIEWVGNNLKELSLLPVNYRHKA